MSARVVVYGFWRAREQFRKMLKGMIYGIAIGETLGYPFKDIPLGKKLYFQNEKIDYIDKFYQSNIGLKNDWPIETALALNSFWAFIDIHQHVEPLKNTITGPFLNMVLFRRISLCHEKTVTPPDDSKNLIRLNNQVSLFMRLAPLAPFSCRCCLNTKETIEVALIISKFFTREHLKIFPAIEFVLLLKSIFEKDELIPDVLNKMRFLADNDIYKDQFDEYIRIRKLPLDRISPGSDLWIWKKIINSILGLKTGGQWADIQTFENGVLKVVNDCFVRNRAGAIAGALLGALGRNDLPFRFYTNIIGDIYLVELMDSFISELFAWKRNKEYNPSKIVSRQLIIPEKVEEKPELRYISSEKISCAFYTIAVKNESLKNKYPDGLDAFLKIHKTICNDWISVACSMSDELEEIVLDLKKNNFEFGKDYFAFDANDHHMDINWDQESCPKIIPVHLNVDWLNAEIYTGKGFRIWYKKEVIIMTAYPDIETLNRYMKLLFLVFIQAREKSMETDKTVSDLMDVVHNVPDLLPNWPSMNEDWLLEDLKKYESKYAENEPVFSSILENKSSTHISMLEKAIQLATHAHSNQIDKAGSPYILHPLRLMMKMESENEKIVAVLHDIVEDTPVTLEQLAREGFDTEILNAVDRVTNRPEESYDDFIIRAASNPIGYKVKMADLNDNLDISRIPNPTQKDFQRLSKYRKAIRTLETLGEFQKNDCNKITKIEIVKTENDQSSTILSAKISDDGDLIIDDYFIGKFAQEVYDHDDSESFVKVKKDFKNTLLLLLLKERFQANSELRDWLSLNNVPYDFEIWP